MKLSLVKLTPVVLYFVQDINAVANKFNLGLNIRTAAYMHAVQQIVTHYADAGLTFI